VFFAQAPAVEAHASQVRVAIEKGLQQLERGARNYPKHRQCFSCHHQAVPMLAMHAARKRGFAVDEKLLLEQVDFTMKSFATKKGLEKGQGVGGASTTVGYGVLALAAARQPRDATVAAMLEFLLVRQAKDGSWTAQARRPPSEGSPFTSTALALFGFQHYPADSQDSELRKRIDAATRNGLDWLLANRGTDTEDLVFRLRGLVSAAADPAEIDAARRDLLDRQLPDGAWPQLPDMKGDAYATAAALTTLRLAGLSASHAAYSKGVQYLLSTQTDAGAWIVATRSRPIQTFFDNGDAGGASQFISFPATAWAVLALLETIEPVRK
jgi:N-acyl-D-amino-acid deacylase